MPPQLAKWIAFKRRCARTKGFYWIAPLSAYVYKRTLIKMGPLTHFPASFLSFFVGCTFYSLSYLHSMRLIPNVRRTNIRKVVKEEQSEQVGAESRKQKVKQGKREGKTGLCIRPRSNMKVHFIMETNGRRKTYHGFGKWSSELMLSVSMPVFSFSAGFSIMSAG